MEHNECQKVPKQMSLAVGMQEILTILEAKRHHTAESRLEDLAVCNYKTMRRRRILSPSEERSQADQSGHRLTTSHKEADTQASYCHACVAGER
jgi:hypothetical protein